MKKFLFPLLLLLVAAFSLSAQEIRNIDETVVLRKDGSARITQVWDVTVVSGTEFYLPFDNLGRVSARASGRYPNRRLRRRIPHRSR